MVRDNKESVDYYNLYGSTILEVLVEGQGEKHSSSEGRDRSIVLDLAFIEAYSHRDLDKNRV
nr:hypothetical protein [Candidatus Njordarchaeota archaeon]